MKKVLYQLNRVGAFISLPIILLLLFISTLSYGFYQTLSDERQWRSQQQNALNNQVIWQAFEMDIAFQVNASMATMSECEGFCPLTNISEGKWLQEYDFLFSNQFEKIHWFFSKSLQNNAFFRLCAWRKTTNKKKCWWYSQSAQTNSGILVFIGSMPM